MTSSAAQGKRGRPWLRRVLLALLTLIGVGGFVTSLVLWFGVVTGEEFCPQTFQRRSFWLVELPLLHWPLSGEHRQDCTGLCEQELVKHTWVAAAPSSAMTSAATPSAAAQWHLVWQRRGGRRQTGDAWLLVQYLDSRDDEGELRWLRWSEAHPELARRLWPAVQQLALKEQYLWIPDLFLLARQHADPTRLDQALQAWLAQAAAESGTPQHAAATSAAADAPASDSATSAGQGAPPRDASHTSGTPPSSAPSSGAPPAADQLEASPTPP